MEVGNISSLSLLQSSLLAFERQDGLTAEEEEQRSLAKRKMLGNIRFVGQLPILFVDMHVVHQLVLSSCYCRRAV